MSGRGSLSRKRRERRVLLSEKRAYRHCNGCGTAFFANFNYVYEVVRSAVSTSTALDISYRELASFEARLFRGSAKVFPTVFHYTLNSSSHVSSEHFVNQLKFCRRFKIGRRFYISTICFTTIIISRIIYVFLHNSVKGIISFFDKKISCTILHQGRKD